MRVSSMAKVFFDKWIAKRHNVNRLLLNHNTIYILPSKLGALFLSLTLVLFIVGVNYQNNLLLLSSYLFVLIQIYAFIMSFKNLYQVEFELIEIKSTFSPSKPHAKIKVSSTTPYRSLYIAQDNLLRNINLVDQAKSEIIALPYVSRGKYPFPRLSIYSNYPFGLVKAFSYWQPTENAYVYPALNLQANESEFNELQDEDLEYHGIKLFMPSDNPVRMSWKHVARTGELYVKRFDKPVLEQSKSEVYLSYSEEVGDKEHRLSSLATKLKMANGNSQSVVLQMPYSSAIKCVDERTFTLAWETLSEY